MRKLWDKMKKMSVAAWAALIVLFLALFLYIRRMFKVDILKVVIDGEGLHWNPASMANRAVAAHDGYWTAPREDLWYDISRLPDSHAAALVEFYANHMNRNLVQEIKDGGGYVWPFPSYRDRALERLGVAGYA